jgi:hypothetical protein
MKFNTSSSIMQFLLVFGLLFTYPPVAQADHGANLTEFVYLVGEPDGFSLYWTALEVEFYAKERTQLPKTDQLLVPDGKIVAMKRIGSGTPFWERWN